MEDYSFLPAIDYVATRLQVAAMIVYGRNWPYSATPEGKIVLDASTSSTVNRWLDEHQRAGAAIGILKQSTSCKPEIPNQL